MKPTRILVAAVFAVALGVAPAAFANHEKGNHDGGGPPGKWRHGGPGCGISPEHRALMKDAMEKAHKANAGLMKEAEAKRKALQAALSAKTFDRKAFLAATDDLAALQAKKHHNMAEAFADVAEKLSPEERKKCPMFAGGMHGPGMRHGGPGGPGGPGGWKHHRGGPGCGHGKGHMGHGKMGQGRMEHGPRGGGDSGFRSRSSDWSGLNQ